MRGFRLIVEYDGTHFHGWQCQEGSRTVEGELCAASRRLSSGAVESAGASRTDSGVHALGQSALIRAETNLDANAFGRALEALTPRDIGIVRCSAADPEFHPRFSALEKRYLYRVVSRRRTPLFGRGYEWWVRAPLDLARMQAAARLLTGTHDYAAFQNRSKDPPESSVRTLRALDCQQSGDRFAFQCIGDGFLYRMVRNLAGTLVDVGRGKLAADDCREILASRERSRAGPSAPPEGLYLMEVAYPDTPLCAIADLGAPPASCEWEWLAERRG